MSINSHVVNDLQTSLDGLTLVRPDPERDAPFALAWFESPYGKETLLLMGNAEDTITAPTLEGEKNTLKEFLALEKAGKQHTWMIRYDNKTIGAVWIDLKDTKYVRSPALHIMIGDRNYRGQGIGRIVMQKMIHYAKHVLKAKALYSRHLTANAGITRLNIQLGFNSDGPAYKDEDGLEFQNIKLAL